MRSNKLLTGIPLLCLLALGCGTDSLAPEELRVSTQASQGNDECEVDGDRVEASVEIPGNGPPYAIGIGCNFPPWNAPCNSPDPIRESFDFELAELIFGATNTRAVIELRDYEDCVAPPDYVSAAQPMDQGEVVGCLTWSDTQARKDQGLVFSSAYAGSAPVLKVRRSDTRFDSLGAGDSLAALCTGSDPCTIGLTGFANDDICLGRTYDIEGVEFQVIDGGDAEGALSDEDIDAYFSFGENFPPYGEDVKSVGVFTNCGGASLVTYPGATCGGGRSQRLLRRWNEGLEIIRADGSMAALCESWQARGLDPRCLLN